VSAPPEDGWDWPAGVPHAHDECPECERQATVMQAMKDPLEETCRTMRQATRVMREHNDSRIQRLLADDGDVIAEMEKQWQ
jgi:predicted nucleic acid-binding Zn ribbon protein